MFDPKAEKAVESVVHCLLITCGMRLLSWMKAINKQISKRICYDPLTYWALRDPQWLICILYVARMATSSSACHAYQAVVDVDTNAVSSELLIPKLICKQHRLAEKLKWLRRLKDRQQDPERGDKVGSWPPSHLNALVSAEISILIQVSPCMG